METTLLSGLPELETPKRASRFLRGHYPKLFGLFQVLVDFATVVASYLGAHVFYVYGLERASPQNTEEFLILSLVAGLIYVLFMDRVGLYKRETSLLNINEIRGIFRVAIYAAAVILGLTFYFRSVDLSRITLTLAIAGTPVFLLMQRKITYKLHVLFHQMGWSQKRALIYGAGNIGKLLAKRMLTSPSLGIFPVGFLDDDQEKLGEAVSLKGVGRRNSLRIVGDERILDQAKEKDIDLVLISLPSASFDRNQQVVEKCMEKGLEYLIVPKSYERFIQLVDVYEIGGVPILKQRSFSVGPAYVVMKRLVDFSLSTLFLLVLSPFYFVVGLLIKLDSPGPIIFKQKRTGLRGREFSFYKFRTMYLDSDKYTTSPKSYKDERITKLGRWLRRTSLDELPQLFNVFRGDMSLVGPRPEMPFIVANYSPLERLRLEAKPGITGVWQISADRGDPIHQNLEYDLFYLKNRSLLLDLSIILKTMWSVVRGVGAF